MFDTAYTFHLIDHKQLSVDGPHICTWKYNFRSYRRRYIVEVEMYNGPIYIIKYYANCHAASSNKFNLLLNDERPAPIVRTCIDIMLRLYKTDPLASFGFIGSHSVNKTRKGAIFDEEKANTQRFRKHHSLEQFKAAAEKMFATLYVALEE